MITLSLLLAPFALPALAEPPVVTPAADERSGITWFDGGFSNAYGKARSEDKLLCVYFWADASESCRKFFNGTLADDHSVDALSDVVCLGADTQSASGRKLVERFNVQTLPTLLFFGPEGEPEDVIIGFIDPGGFVEEMRRIKSGEKTVSTLRAQVTEAPEDLERHARLVQKLDDVGNWEAAQEARGAILELDPKAETDIGAMAHFTSIKLDTYAAKAESGELDLAPMYKFARKLNHEGVLVEAWSWLATGEAIKEDFKRSRKAYATMWGHMKVPEDGELSGFLNPGCQLVDAYWQGREELTGKERKLALEVSEKMLEVCHAIPEEDGVWAILYDRMARAQYMNKKKKDAIATMERCVEMAPDNPTFREHLEQLRSGA